MRPQSFKEYVGQDRAVRLIKAELPSPRHILLYGQPGLGKTSLASVVATEAKMEFHPWQGALTPREIAIRLMDLSIEGYDKSGRPGQNASRHLVFLDEVHELPNFEVLYSVLEDRTLNPDPTGGVSWLPVICFVAATTNPHVLPKPFLDRFPLQLRLDPYGHTDLKTMVRKRFPSLSDKEVLEVARRSRGTARVAINLGESVLKHGVEYFDLMGIDGRGLTELDHNVLRVLRKAGRAVSLNSLAAMVRENPNTIRDVVEPFLIAEELMEITPKGRVATGVEMGSRGPLHYAL